MDLLIELIVWLFKALAGENEKAKRAAKGLPPLPPARGPYNYGDSRAPQNPNAAAPNTPRTLEEILREVQRSQQARAQTPNTQQRAQARPPVRTVPVPVPAPKRATLPDPFRAGAERQLVSGLDARAIKQTLDAKEIVKPAAIEQKFDRLKTREDERFRPLSEQSAAQGAPALQQITAISVVEDVQASSQASTAARALYFDFFNTLRTAAPETRHEMARNAIVYMTIFGPPKGLRRRQRH